MQQAHIVDDEAIENLATTLAVVFSALSLPDRQWLNHVLARTARAYPSASATRMALERICSKSTEYLERNTPPSFAIDEIHEQLYKMDAPAPTAAAYRHGMAAHTRN